MKKAKAANGKNKKKLKIKDLTAGRKAGGVKGGALTQTSAIPVNKAINTDFRKIVPCV